VSQLKRRGFLRGLGGIAIGLPFLGSLDFVRGSARAQAVNARRFIAFFQCNGANMSKFWPSGSYGALSQAHFPADRTLAPLANYRDKLTIVRNLHMAPKGFGQDPNTNGDDHGKGMGHKLTAQPLDTSGFAQGISLDQFLAKQLNPQGRAPMTLGVHQAGGGGVGSISYRAAGQPVTSEINPRLAFQDLMGINYSSALPVRDLLTERRKSVLDLVQADFAALQVKKLSRSDQQKLDLHLTTIRDLETQLGSGGGSVLTGCVPLADARLAQIQGVTSVSDDAQFKNVGRMQMDLIALSLACDHNRVATLQWGRGSGGPVFKWDGMSHTYNHHKLSHGNTADDNSGSAVAGYEQMIADIDRWFAGEFAYLLDKLNAYDEGDRSLLDNSAVLWINELSDGKDHDFRDLPCVIAGGAGGALKTGQYVNVSSNADARQTNFPDLDAPHNKLLTTLANAVGAKDTDGGPVKRFGHPSYGAAGNYDQLLA
jgi:Protein of unknown function (DUF1552)